MKSAISTIAFTVTFGFSVLLVGLFFGFPQTNYNYTNYSRITCLDQTCQNIERLIYQDISNGQLRNLDTQSLELSSNGTVSISKFAEAVSEYVDNSQSMDDSNLPSDVRNAWHNHMQAWRNYSNFLNKRKLSSRPLSYDEFYEFDSKFTSEINRTWHKTLRVGRIYGADI